MKYQITSFELLKQILAGLSDNPDLPWETYPCLEWPRGCNNNGGYARIKPGGNAKAIMVHRLAYTLTFGPIPYKLLICHKCDNPPCFRPSHLFLGNYKANRDDCVRKNRMVNARGSQSGGAKLTEQQVIEILGLRANGWEITPIAERFKIHRGHCWKILRGQRWQHVTLGNSGT